MVQIRNITTVLLILFRFTVYGQDTLSVLFLGNSYTAVNNLPELVKNLASSAGKTLTVDANMPGGFSISNHLSDPISNLKIKLGKWDYIVIQEQSQIPSIDYYRYNDMYPALTALKDTIENYQPCAKIITYMTWGRRYGGRQCDPSNTHCSPDFVDFNHMQDSITSAYLQISKQLKIQCAPVGEVWKTILQDTTLELHSTDNSHPSLDGSYVAACAIYSCLFKQPSSGINYTALLTPNLAKYYQSKSDSTIFDSTKNWNLFINNPTANFNIAISGYSASFTNLSTASQPFLDYFWDFGDGNKSTLLNPTHTYTSKGLYTAQLIASNCIFSDTISKNFQIGTTAIEEHANNLFKIYPNPGNNQLTLIANPNLIGSEYTIYNQIGTSLFNGQIDSENTILNVENLSSGLYFLRVGNWVNPAYKIIIDKANHY